MLQFRQVFAGLFPAHAGVIPELGAKLGVQKTFPRTRGGDPLICSNAGLSSRFSPYTRGGDPRDAQFIESKAAFSPHTRG